jgi:hypothetical protein
MSAVPLAGTAAPDSSSLNAEDLVAVLRLLAEAQSPDPYQNSHTVHSHAVQLGRLASRLLGHDIVSSRYLAECADLATVAAKCALLDPEHEYEHGRYLGRSGPAEDAWSALAGEVAKAVRYLPYMLSDAGLLGKDI